MQETVSTAFDGTVRRALLNDTGSDDGADGICHCTLDSDGLCKSIPDRKDAQDDQKPDVLKVDSAFHK